MKLQSIIEATKLKEGEERSEIKDLMIPHIKEYLERKGPGSFISMEDLESDLYDFARRITHDDLNSPQYLRDFMSNPGDEASSAVGELISGMYQAEFDDYITTEGRIEDTFGTKTIDKHDRPEKKKPKKEDIELNDNMIGEPDDFYGAEERQEAHKDLQDALQGNYMDDYIIDGSCPACGGSGYMDGEETFTNDDGEEEESSECDGFGNYGCDEGEMTYGSDGPSWVEIIKHDKQQADRKDATANYPGDEEVIKGLANMMKSMDDPRMAYQQMQVDYPQMGRAQRSNLIAKAKQMAFPEESITEGDERRIIHRATVDNLISQFDSKVDSYETLVDLHDAVYNELSYLDMEDVGLEDAEDGGQPLTDYHNGRVLDVLDSYSVIDDVVSGLDLSDMEESKIQEDDMDMEKDNESNEAGVSKMLAKALGDPNRWTEMSAPELYAELESTDSKKAEMIALVAKMIYDVKLTEANRIEEDQDMFKELRIDDNTYISDGNKELTPAEVGSGFYLLGYDRSGSCFEMSKISKEDAKNNITGSGEYKVADAEITDFDGARYYYNQNMPDSGILHIKSLSGVKAVSKDESIEESYDCDDTFFEDYGYLGYSIDENDMFEAEYQGRKVKLNKPMQGDVKKFKVYVKDPKTGNVKKVNFGHGGSSVKGKAMKIRKNNPKARKSFRARHNCDSPGPKTKARYWSCRKW